MWSCGIDCVCYWYLLNILFICVSMLWLWYYSQPLYLAVCWGVFVFLQLVVLYCALHLMHTYGLLQYSFVWPYNWVRHALDDISIIFWRFSVVYFYIGVFEFCNLQYCCRLVLNQQRTNLMVL